MKAVKYSSLQKKFKKYMKYVTDDYETLIIKRKKGRNVVMMPLDQYNNLMESIHLLSTDLNRAALEKSIKQLEQGVTVEKSLIDDGDSKSEVV